jgi:hypothetical protein
MAMAPVEASLTTSTTSPTFKTSAVNLTKFDILALNRRLLVE